MTPTERATVAEACCTIWARETGYIPFESFLPDSKARWLKAMTAVLECALAPAPADQSDAFRHGIDGTDTGAWLRRQARREGKLVKALKAAKPMIQNFAGESPDNERIYNLVCDAIEGAPDQSDAGRDGVIGSVWRHLKTGHVVTIVGRCRLEATNDPAYLYDHDGVIWARSMDQFLDGRFERHSGFASVPSEAPKPPDQEPGGDPGVGRGDEAQLESSKTAWAAAKVREMLAQGINLQGTGEGVNSVIAGILRSLIAHIDELEADLKCAIAVGRVAARATIPTADRDAIRETMEGAKTFIENHLEDVQDHVADYSESYIPRANERVAKLTAALALIGEGK